MAQLPSFLPALFEAFGNQSADVRKVILLFLDVWEPQLCFKFRFFIGWIKQKEKRG